MAWLPTAGLAAVSVLFAVVGFYLTLIAKFYRQKFMKGPPWRWMQASLAVTVAGLALETGFLEAVPGEASSLLICAGGLAFSGFAYLLYRTMMSKS